MGEECGWALRRGRGGVRGPWGCRRYSLVAMCAAEGLLEGKGCLELGCGECL